MCLRPAPLKISSSGVPSQLASLGPSPGELVGGEEQGACATPGPAHPRAIAGLPGTFKLGRTNWESKIYLTRSKLGWTRPEPPPLHRVPSGLVSTARVCFWEVFPFFFLPQMRASNRQTSDLGKGLRGAGDLGGGGGGGHSSQPGVGDGTAARVCTCAGPHGTSGAVG